MPKQTTNEGHNINKMIKKIRKDLKLTQADVAKKMNMKLDTYSKKERLGNITIDWAHEFAKAVGVNPAVFKSVFETENKLNFTPVDGTKLIFNDPNDFWNKVYKPVIEETKTEPALEVPKNASPNFSFKPSVKEHSLFETIHYFSKENQQKVIDLVNQLKQK